MKNKCPFCLGTKQVLTGIRQFESGPEENPKVLEKPEYEACIDCAGTGRDLSAIDDHMGGKPTRYSESF